MTYISVTETAKMLRKSLKEQHPGVKFSVRSSSYSGGASIDVGWTDGPTEAQVKATTSLYSGATFDGMQDLMEYHDTLLATDDGVISVHFGANFIFTNRTLSDDFLDLLAANIQQNGTDDHSSRCDGCGNWMEPGRRWVAPSIHTGQAFTCSPRCAAKLEARITSA